jgi:hypothetical protein
VARALRAGGAEPLLERTRQRTTRRLGG